MTDEELEKKILEYLKKTDLKVDPSDVLSMMSFKLFAAYGVAREFSEIGKRKYFVDITKEGKVTGVHLLTEKRSKEIENEPKLIEDVLSCKDCRHREEYASTCRDCKNDNLFTFYDWKEDREKLPRYGYW